MQWRCSGQTSRRRTTCSTACSGRTTWLLSRCWKTRRLGRGSSSRMRTSPGTPSSATSSSSRPPYSSRRSRRLLKTSPSTRRAFLPHSQPCPPPTPPPPARTTPHRDHRQATRTDTRFRSSSVVTTTPSPRAVYTSSCLRAISLPITRTSCRTRTASTRPRACATA